MFAQVNLIPNFLKARTLDELRALMLANNFRNQKQYIYQDIQNVDGSWFAFYYEQVESDDKIYSSVAMVRGSK